MMDVVFVAATAARRLLLVHNATRAHHRPSSTAAPPAPRESSFPMLLPVFILFVLLLCFLSVFLLRDLLHFSSLWLRRRRARLRRADAASAASSTPDAPPRKPAGLDPAVLAALPTLRWLHDDDAAPGAAECAVCLCEFAAGDAVRLLTACRHAFHTPCIDSWLRAHTTCPVCRSQLDAPPPDDGDRGGGGPIEFAVDVQGARHSGGEHPPGEP